MSRERRPIDRGGSGRVPCILLSLLAVALGLRAAAAGPETPDVRPAAALFEKLLRVPPQLLVLQTSSANKKGQNGDADWPLYKDARGDDVVFDAAGPGCVRSMWGTAFDPAAVFQFYFDGETEPRLRIPVLDLYKGLHPLFPPPLVSYERRGRWGDEPFAGNSFVPIPFAESLKISVRGGSRFFHIIFERTPYPSGGSTFTGREADRGALRDAFEHLGEPPLRPGPEKGRTVTVPPREGGEIAPGETVPLLKLEGTAGIVREIVLETDGGEDFFQGTFLKMRWDGHPLWDVQAPPGLLFGSAVRANDVRALPVRVEPLADGRVRLSCFFPMPFWEGAEIAWTNATARPMAAIEARITVDENPVPRGEGAYFTTMYHAGRTAYGHDWELFEGRGAGWYVGTVQSMRESHYCEGDEHITLDGAVAPQINGTGTEDYYLACFWPNVDFDSPFACVAGDIQREGGGTMAGAYHVPASYARYHLEAPFPFFASIDARIQHGGRSDVLSDYRSLGIAYLRKTERLVQTDFIDVGLPESEKAHGYRASTGGAPVALEAYPEGGSSEVASTDEGRYHSGGTVRFRAAVDPANAGVRLRRLYDQKGPRQSVRVTVDGRYAGTWLDAKGNEFLRWAESDFDIAPRFSRGKSSLEIELVVETGEGRSPFSDFRYKVFCLK
jgi:hypothetical protein